MFRKTTSNWLLSTAAALSLTACGGNGDSESEGPAREATEAVSKKIEAFTGDHSKMVWTKYVGGGSSDAYLTYSKHQLWGIDTRDGKGIRVIQETPNNYGRPMVSPDGESIIWTNKGGYLTGEKDEDGRTIKGFKPVIYQTDWSGENVKELGKGYAVDVWRDPETGISWVYAADLAETNRASLYADKLERFQLDEPDTWELVWDKTQLSTENIQLSKDGKRASALFPWPDAGIIDLEAGENRVNNFGCWPSLAPDNSYYAWVFAGDHKHIHLFDDAGEKRGKIEVGTAPGIGSAEVYHPRWSNDVRFFTMTGPYAGESIGKSNAKVVEVYIGRFDEEITEVEDWLQVTENEKADFFPDLWVKQPEEAAPAASVAEAPPKKKTEKRKWPMTSGRLLFLWENRKTANVVDSNGRISKVEAREQARFGPNFDMLCDGGYFEADEETSAAVDGHLGLNRFRYTLEALVTPFSADQNGTVLSTKAFQIQQRGDDLLLVSTRPLPTAYWFGKAEPGMPVHLGVIFNGLEYLIYHNGKVVSQEGHEVKPDMLAAHPGLTFGEGWDGALEGVSIVPGTIDEWRLERGAEYLLAKVEDRESIPRVRLKGKLLEMTAERSIGDMDYNRALTCYLYEVEEVIEGKLKDKKVLVYHWTIMDRKPLQSFPRRPGQSYELLLEPLTDTNHPEIVGEQKWSDLDGYSFNEGLKLYYDVETPKD